MLETVFHLVMCRCLLVAMCCPPAEHEIRSVAGWQVHVSKRLLQQEGPATARALELLKIQLDEVVRVLPKPVVTRLQQVPLWFSPEYPGVRPTAEYHPNRQWLCDHGRDPALAKAVEFTNVRLFEKETRRMPFFAFHELAHAYHDQVLGFDNAEIQAAYEAAKKSGRYDKVKRWTGEKVTEERAYAMTNAKEYFAESSEAYFGRNDFYPFARTEFKEHDPQMHDLLERLWQYHTEPTAPACSH
jgi:hypothetical protein